MNKKKISQYFFILLILSLLIIAYKIIDPYITYIVLSAILAYSFYPLYRKFANKTKHKSLAAIILVTIVLTILVVPLFLSLFTIVKNSSTLQISVDSEFLELVSQSLKQKYGLDLELGTLAQDMATKIKDFIIANSVKLAGQVADIIIGLFIMFVSMYYLFLQGPQITEKIKNSLPLKEEYKEGILRETKSVTYAVVYSQILVSVVQGSLVGISFAIFQFPDPILWGFIAAILSFLPVVGAPIIWIPFGVVSILQGNLGMAIGMIIFNLVITTNIDNIMRPRIVSRRAKLHPFLTLVGVLGGVKFFGFTGLLLGPLFIAMFLVFLQYFNQEFIGNKA